MDCFSNRKDKTEACTQPRRRRSRTVFAPEAIYKMEELFNKNRYPDIHERDTLALELNLPEPRIQVWFQNRRSRTKKRHSSKEKPHSTTPNEIASAESTKDQSDQSTLSKDDNIMEKEKEQALSNVQQSANFKSHPTKMLQTRQETDIYSTTMLNSYVSDMLYRDWLSLPYDLTSLNGWFPSLQHGNQQEFITNHTYSNRELGNQKTSTTLHTSGSSSEDDCIVDRLFRFSKSRQQRKDKKRKREEGEPYTMKVPRIHKVDCSTSKFERSEDRRSDITSTEFSAYPDITQPLAMNPLERLEIHLENSREGTYLTGQNVPGKLVIVLRRNLKIQGIEIKVRGRGHAQWKEGEGEMEQLLFETEDYVKQSIMVVGKEPDRNSPPHIEFLDSGQNTFHFNFTVPENIPSSFEGLHGYIRYWVKAKIYGIWGLLDQSGKVEFGVQRPLDLNTVPGAMDPAEVEDSCILCGCCLNSGYVQASLRINKRGFIPGESIIYNAEIYNGSDSSLKSTKIKFYRMVTYGDSPFESITTEKKTMSEITRGKVKSGHLEVYKEESITLPSVLPVTSLPGCSFIDIDYVVELKVTSSIEECNLRVPILVIVGTIPYKDLTVQENSEEVWGSSTENSAVQEPVNYQPFVSDPFIAGQQIHTPTISVAPIGTELQSLYPPMRNLSILEREKTLNEIYRKRRRAVRFMGIVNEAAYFDDEEELEGEYDYISRATTSLTVDTKTQENTNEDPAKHSNDDYDDTSV